MALARAVRVGSQHRAIPIGIADALGAGLAGGVGFAPGAARRAFAAAAVAADAGASRGLVSCEWLREELGRGGEAPRIVDATWYLAGTAFGAPAGSPGSRAEHIAGPRLPGARFFDLEAIAAKHPKNLPHMMPDEDMFASAMAALGIRRSTRVVVYDRIGMFSAPRFWYMLKVVYGHPADVAVLDGGLPRWKELGYPMETGPAADAHEGGDSPAATDKWRKTPGTVWDIDQMLANVTRREVPVFDARPAARFKGGGAEPRPGMRPGHIPGSMNLPFPELITEGPVRMLRKEGELRELLRRAGASVEEVVGGKGGPVVTTCGSGMTACIAQLALHQLGMPLERCALYDGSWSEWGAEPHTPVEQGDGRPSRL